MKTTNVQSQKSKAIGAKKGKIIYFFPKVHLFFIYIFVYLDEKENYGLWYGLCVYINIQRFLFSFVGCRLEIRIKTALSLYTCIWVVSNASKITFVYISEQRENGIKINKSTEENKFTLFIFHTNRIFFYFCFSFFVSTKFLLYSCEEKKMFNNYFDFVHH